MILSGLSIANFRNAFAKPTDFNTKEGRAQERKRRIALTALTSAIAKVFSTVIPFITIRYTLEYLGVELYGLWNAVTSFFALFVFADLGLANGLQTQLSSAYGHENKIQQRKIIFNTYLVLISVALLLISLYFIVNPFINWDTLMNAKNSNVASLVSSVVLAIVIPKLIMVPLSLIQRVQYSYQEGYNSNVWQCVASVLSIVFILIIYYCNLGRLMMIWAASIIPLIIYMFNSIFYYSRKKLHFFTFNNYDLTLIKLLLGNGVLYFLLSILTTSGLSLDTFIVARVADLDEATPYSIMLRVASIINIIIMMLCAPLWPANGEAMARGEYDWVKRNTLKMCKITFSLSFILSLIVLALSKWAFRIWLGPNFSFSFFCLGGMCLTQIILSTISPFFMVLNAANIVKYQIFSFLFFTIISLSLKFTLSPIIGVKFMPWITNTCYLIFIVPFIYKKSRSILNLNRI